MDTRSTDIAIAGGGLAGGLIALALARACPQLSLAVFEGGATLGGNHRWSWFDSDLDEAGTALMSPFVTTAWDKGYDVAFPKYRRTLTSTYRSLASPDFHSALIEELDGQQIALGAKIASLDANSVTLANGERHEARVVIDCRGFEPTPHLKGGWQVFLGQHFHLPEPHGEERPVIMDASVDQHAPHGNMGAYRFVYTLPLGERDIFLEDTYYADDPALDRSALSGRIASYASALGWQGELVGEETGVLPVMTGGDFDAYQRSVRIPGVAVAGARGGFAHPLTSYTLPVAVETALAIAEWASSQGSALNGVALADLLEKRARRQWRRTGFYRLLARMLFFAGEPEKRFAIFQRFYRLPEPLIERFYAGNTSLGDRVRILSGKAPVSIPSAIKALAKSGTPLTTEKPA